MSVKKAEKNIFTGGEGDEPRSLLGSKEPRIQLEFSGIYSHSNFSSWRLTSLHVTRGIGEVEGIPYQNSIHQRAHSDL